jgi:uncharacterized protein YsxB (DUF464 family)
MEAHMPNVDTEFTPEQSARMADNFEKMNKAARGFHWDDVPLSFKILLYVCAGFSAVVVASVLGIWLLNAITVTAANALDPFAGKPW